MNQYRDKRQDFFKSWFNKGLNYSDYIKTGSSIELAKWNNFEKNVVLSDDQINLVKSFNRKVNLLILSGIWCGDCQRQIPILKKFSDINDNITIKLLDNRENPELQEELRINGAEKVPVVVVLSEDFFELQRFGDVHLERYRDKLKSQLGAACDPGLFTTESESRSETNSWLELIERCYAVLRISPMLRKRYND